ncbi:MAG: DUF1295 domain-containing protein [Actinomycetota bacterium]
MQEKVIYNILLWTVFASSILIFAALFFIKAPYGRHYRKGWGLATSARLGWMVMESPAVLVMAYLFFNSTRSSHAAALVFFLVWMSHYIQRTFVYPLLMKGGRKSFPILLVVFAMAFNTINAYLNGRYLFYFSPPYRVEWLTGPRFICGFILFAAGLTINVHSDSILRSLRKMEGNGYKIPSRGFFKYVSSPNYFGEMVEWIGWAVLTWSVPGLAFAVFTIANLLPRALANHRWYKQKFSRYPEERKILVPFIF